MLTVPHLGCSADEGVSFYISQQTLPDDNCAFQLSNLFITSGTLDLSLTKSYSLYPMFNNQLFTRTASNTLSSADTTKVQIEGARVTILDINRKPIYAEYTVPGTTLVPSATQEGPGRAIGELQVIPESKGNELETKPGAGNTVFLSIVAFGKTLGGLDVESGAFLWPVQVCNCCLRTGLPKPSDYTACLVGQDRAVPEPRTNCM